MRDVFVTMVRALAEKLLPSVCPGTEAPGEPESRLKVCVSAEMGKEPPSFEFGIKDPLSLDETELQNISNLYLVVVTSVTDEFITFPLL